MKLILFVIGVAIFLTGCVPLEIREYEKEIHELRIQDPQIKKTLKSGKEIPDEELEQAAKICLHGLTVVVPFALTNATLFSNMTGWKTRGELCPVIYFKNKYRSSYTSLVSDLSKPTFRLLPVGMRKIGAENTRTVTCGPELEAFTINADGSIQSQVNVNPYNIGEIVKDHQAQKKASQDKFTSCIAAYNATKLIQARLTKPDYSLSSLANKVPDKFKHYINSHTLPIKATPEIQALSESAEQSLREYAQRYKTHHQARIDEHFAKREKAIQIGMNVYANRLAFANTSEGFKALREEFLSKLDRYNIDSKMQQCVFQQSALSSYLNQEYLIDVNSKKLSMEINNEGSRTKQCMDDMAKTPIVLLNQLFPSDVEKSPLRDKAILKHMGKFISDVDAAKPKYLRRSVQTRNGVIRQINVLVSAGKIEARNINAQRQHDRRMAEIKRKQREAEKKRQEDLEYAEVQERRRRNAQIEQERSDANAAAWKAASDALLDMQRGLPCIPNVTCQ